MISLLLSFNPVRGFLNGSMPEQDFTIPITSENK